MEELLVETSGLSRQPYSYAMCLILQFTRNILLGANVLVNSTPLTIAWL